MANISLYLKKLRQEGDLTPSYGSLKNIVDVDGNIKDFRTTEIEVDPEHPLSVECQPSYDGTVNILINDDKHPPRIINSRFSKIEDSKFKVITRNQVKQSNLYEEGSIDAQTRLFRNLNSIPVIDLNGVYNTGCLKGGNYTFYIKFADDDYNKTDIVAESGMVSIFKGQPSNIHSISGTLLDEKTDKAVVLNINNVDRAFAKIYVYYTRDYCDTTGVRMTTAHAIVDPYEIRHDRESITITGFEDTKEISVEELNIQYNLVTAAKSQAQVQNMLFLGNVQGINLNLKDLQQLSYFIEVKQKQSGDSIGYIDPNTYTTNIDSAGSEYYSPTNIYYKLGYWPDEIYRLGVVYIMNDDSLSPVFSLRGCEFTGNNSSNLDNTALYKDESKSEFNYLERDSFIERGNWLSNTFGVFKTSKASIIGVDSVKPLYYEVSFGEEVVAGLKRLGVKGYFFVRQKRIPTSLCQGFSVGVDNACHIPTPYFNGKYIAESFISKERQVIPSYSGRLISTDRVGCSGLLSLDAAAISNVTSALDGSEFVLQGEASYTLTSDTKEPRHYYTKDQATTTKNAVANLVYVQPDTPLKYMNGFSYSTKCGASEDVRQFGFFGEEDKENSEAINLIRGQYCPFIGTSEILEPNTVYTIKSPNFSSASIKKYFEIRKDDNSSFYPISNRYSLDKAKIDLYRGDCYTNTVTIRINRNFIDSDVPINEMIIDANTWRDNYKGYSHMLTNGELTKIRDDKDYKKDENKGDYTLINRGDLNAVPMGMWVSFKCLSNYNLGLRSIDRSHVDETALMGNPRSFYPATDITTNVSNKIEESWLVSEGYGATVGQKRYYKATNVPYIRELFDNRVMFSNVQAYGDFQNNYRVFQGLDYQDIDRQYGAITKILPWNGNLLAIFEHGIGILPINEKAIFQTQNGQSIHMKGAGVMSEQISVISSDFGSTWAESIIQTPQGVYGVDTAAKKIWRVGREGLSSLSDMKVQRFLNDNIKLYEEDKSPIVALRNVKTHYNNFKGDVMFTFYNEDKDTTWNLCYNERMDKWVTRYSWTPLYSGNINNTFYSFDRDKGKIISTLYNNHNTNLGVRATGNWNTGKALLTLAPGSAILTDLFDITIDKVETATYYDGDEHKFTITDGEVLKKLFTKSAPTGNDTTVTVSVNEPFAKEYFGDTVPCYYILHVTVTSQTLATKTDDGGNTYELREAQSSFPDVVAIITSGNDDQKNYFLCSKLYLHGSSGIFNEINYEDETFDNEILPTRWYDRQEPFEFEFVVNNPTGAHKIFNDLVIISNNVQPNELEFELEGDVYDFNKAGIFRAGKFDPKYLWDPKFNKPITIYGRDKDVAEEREPAVTYQATQEFQNCEVKWDTNLNNYSLLVKQKCKNIKDGRYGRRLGNIQYKEDSWYTNIEPILFKERFRITEGTSETIEPIFREGKVKSTRLRDKYIKVRVKYTGEDLVVITALKTLLTISYA